MTHGSLFSGIGGFDLAASWLGWENVFQCEKDDFCQRILKYHFPNTKLHGDIKEANFKQYAGSIDVVSGGFPCQPFSVSGKQEGENDNRYLWPEMLRAIRDIKPKWIVAENVRGITSKKFELVFERVCSEMENEGYKVQPVIIPACAVGAPHRRDRVWFVANCTNAGIENLQQKREDGISSIETLTHSNSDDARRCGYGETGQTKGADKTNDWEWERIWEDFKRIGKKEPIANSECNGRNKIHDKVQSEQSERNRINSIGSKRNASNPNNINGHISRLCSSKISQFETSGIRDNYWRDFPTQSPICSGNDGISTRLDGITFPRWRAESIKGYGNAIVPQVAFEIFKIINELIQ